MDPYYSERLFYAFAACSFLPNSCFTERLFYSAAVLTS